MRNFFIIMNYIDRLITDTIIRAEVSFPVIVITGPRQSGKSTLSTHIFPTYEKYNFEDLGLKDIVMSDPKGFLNKCGDKVILDEVQNVPELFSYIQLIVDEYPNRRFVLTGSSNFALMERITQSLAGRAALFTLLPFSIKELGGCKDIPTDQLLFNGFYPRVLAGNQDADIYYSSYYSTYVERDLRQIKNITNLGLFQTFIRLLAARVGSEFNASQLSTEIGVSATTVRNWLSLLQTSYIAFQLHPYYVNISKRLTKTPKIYFYDTGLLCFLLEIENSVQLRNHPLRGAIFENLAVIELLKERLNAAKLPNLYYYRENKGREVDIVRVSGLSMDIFEVKSSQTFNKSFIKNLNYLKELLGDQIHNSTVVYDGATIPPLAINIRELTEKF